MLVDDKHVRAAADTTMTYRNILSFPDLQIFLACGTYRQYKK